MNDLSAKRELSLEAKELLENKAFTDAILSLRKRWFAELMEAENTDAKLALIERIKALEAIPLELQTIINDYTMAKRHG
jgi:hypothetical protein